MTKIRVRSRVPSRTPHRTAECACDFFLLCPSLINQTDHCMRLGHAVAQCVLGDHDPRNDHNAMPALRPHKAARIDKRSALRRANFRKEIPLPRCLTHGGTIAGPPKKRTVLGPHPRYGRRGLSGKLQATVSPNIHGLCNARAVDSFRAKETPLCQEVWTHPAQPTRHLNCHGLCYTGAFAVLT
jgi:hypothetical protein